MNPQIATIKVSFKDELRRFPFEGSSFEKLSSQLVCLLGLNSLQGFSIKYRDEEGDMITMTSDLELREALKVSNRLLRISISQKGAHDVTGPTPTPIANPSIPPNNKYGQPNFQKLREEKQKLKQEIYNVKKHLNEFKKNENFKQCKREKLVSRFVKDLTILDGTEISPGSSFVKMWKVRNGGEVDWPVGCRLMFVGNDQMNGPLFVPLDLSEPLKPGQEIDCHVELVAPNLPGRYIGYWRLATLEGKKFGQRLWVNIVVPGSSDEDDKPRQWDAQIKQLEEMGFKNPHQQLRRLLIKHNGKVKKVLKVLSKQNQSMEQK